MITTILIVLLVLSVYCYCYHYYEYQYCYYCYHYGAEPRKWQISRDQFVDACMLAGTEYCLELSC